MSYSVPTGPKKKEDKVDHIDRNEYILSILSKYSKKNEDEIKNLVKKYQMNTSGKKFKLDITIPPEIFGYIIKFMDYEDHIKMFIELVKTEDLAIIEWAAESIRHIEPYPWIWITEYKLNKIPKTKLFYKTEINYRGEEIVTRTFKFNSLFRTEDPIVKQLLKRKETLEHLFIRPITKNFPRRSVKTRINATKQMIEMLKVLNLKKMDIKRFLYGFLSFDVISVDSYGEGYDYTIDRGINTRLLRRSEAYERDWVWISDEINYLLKSFRYLIDEIHKNFSTIEFERYTEILMVSMFKLYTIVFYMIRNDEDRKKVNFDILNKLYQKYKLKVKIKEIHLQIFFGCYNFSYYNYERTDLYEHNILRFHRVLTEADHYKRYFENIRRNTFNHAITVEKVKLISDEYKKDKSIFSKDIIKKYASEHNMWVISLKMEMEMWVNRGQYIEEQKCAYFLENYRDLFIWDINDPEEKKLQEYEEEIKKRFFDASF